MAPVIFAAGDEVEVMVQDEGFEGSMFGARILKSQSNRNRFLIEYETLFDDAVPAKNLRETVDGAHIRPRLPRWYTLGIEIGEKVDAWYNDGWWVGEISKVLVGGKRYMVRFRDGDDHEMEFGFDEVRVHLDWIDGEWIGQKISSEDKFAVSQNLCETEADDLKRLMRSISVAHESQIPLRSSMLSCSSDENSCKLRYSAANLDGINSEKSRLIVHLESSQPCKKPKNREALRSNMKLKRSLLARGVEVPCVLETGFKVATLLLEETPNLHPEALMDCSPCAASPSNEKQLLNPENRLLNPDIATNTVSNTVLEETNCELIFPDNISQQLVQTPSTYEPSLLKEYDKLGDMRSVNKPNIVNFDEPTNHYVAKDVQQLIKKDAVAPLQGCKVPFCCDKFAVSQNLCETEADDLKRLMHSISVAHESQIPLRSSMLSCSSDENSCKLRYSAANLDGINSEKSRLAVHLESSQPCKKPKNREALRSNMKLKRSLLARGVEVPCVLETGFKVATPLIEETSNLHPEALMDCSQCAASPSNEKQLLNPENRLLYPDIVTNIVSNTVLEETNCELIFPDNISQQLVQHTPSTYEPSLQKEEYGKLGDTRSVNKPNIANFDEPTNHYVVKDVQQLIKKDAVAPDQGCKVPFCCGLRQLVTKEKRVIKRKIPWEKRMANTVVEKEGIELKQLQKQQDLVVKRSDSLKYFVRKRCKPEDCDTFIGIQRENDNQDSGEADEPSNGGNDTSHVETVTPELSDIIVESNALVQAREDQKEAKGEALPLSGSQVATRIDIIDRAKANCASHGEEPHDETGRLPAADQEVKVMEGERSLTDHTSKKTCLPFTKISPLWTLMESSEVFSAMPQKPHFLPLMQLSAESREGTAIGLMVTYANLVDSVRKLWISDTNHSLQEMMETLADLERYGFSVQHLQGLLGEFQATRENQKQLLARRSALEGLILERKNKKGEFNAKLELMDSVVTTLERSLECLRDESASILKQRERSEQEILKLQNDKRTTEESSLAAERSFLNSLNALP